MIAGLLALGLAAAPADWAQVSERAGITVWQRAIPGSRLVEFRAEGVIEAGLARMAQVVADTPRKIEWMPHLKAAKILSEAAPTDRVEYQRTNAPWPVKDRDFVFHALVAVDAAAKSLTVSMKSISDPAMPEQPGAVRAEVAGTMILAAQGADRTRVFLEIQADPRGSLPAWVVNLFQRQMPRAMIEGMRRQAAKADVGDHPGVKALFNTASNGL